MRRFIGTVVALALTAGLGVQLRAADDKDAKAILDKAIKAAGGEEKLGKVKAFQSKGKGKISFGDMENDFTIESTVQGLDHLRQIFEGEFGGNKVRGEVVLAGDKGYRDFGGMKADLDKGDLANEHRTIYLQVLPMTLLRELIEIPEHVQKGDFVLRLSEGVIDPAGRQDAAGEPVQPAAAAGEAPPGGGLRPGRPASRLARRHAGAGAT